MQSNFSRAERVFVFPFLCIRNEFRLVYVAKAFSFSICEVNLHGLAFSMHTCVYYNIYFPIEMKTGVSFFLTDKYFACYKEIRNSFWIICYFESERNRFMENVKILIFIGE